MMPSSDDSWKGEYTNTRGGLNCVVRFSLFSGEQAYALFANTVPELPRSGN